MGYYWGMAIEALYRHRAALARFAHALDRLLAVSVPTDPDAACPSWHPLPGREREAAIRAREVDQATDPAALALAAADALPPGDSYIGRGAPDVQRWGTLMESCPEFTAAELLARCHRAIGRLDDVIARTAVGRRWGRRLALALLRGAGLVLVAVAAVAITRLFGWSG